MLTGAATVSCELAVGSRISRLIARTICGDLSWLDREPWHADAIISQARLHGVELILWRELRENGPDALVRPLAEGVASEVARAAVRDRELARLMAHFDTHGVECLVLKGTALAHACYPQPWLRPRIDTDVLVDHGSFEHAVLALAAAGYARSSTFSTGHFVSHQVAFERTDTYGIEHTIDLHWRVFNPQVLAAVVDFETLREDSRPVKVGGVSLRVPSPLWSLVLGCTHRLGHHQKQERLIWLYDLHLLADMLEHDEWLRLVDIARARQISAICADGLCAARSHFGTRVPTSVMQRLSEDGKQDPSRRFVERDVRRLDILRDDLRRLKRWPDRLRLLKEHAFPPAAFMYNRYGSRSRWMLPLLYVRRLVTGAFKWVRT